MPKFGTEKADHATRHQNSSGSLIRKLLPKIEENRGQPMSKFGRTKKNPSHDTRNTHDPKTSPLANTTTKIGGKLCPMDQDCNTTSPVVNTTQLGQDYTTPQEKKPHGNRGSPITKITSNVEGLALPYIRPDRSRKETCWKYRNQ